MNQSSSSDTYPISLRNSNDEVSPSTLGRAFSFCRDVATLVSCLKLQARKNGELQTTTTSGSRWKQCPGLKENGTLAPVNFLD
jgi:hypothetical protein